MTVTVASPFFCQVNLKEQGQLIRQDEFTVFFRKKKCVRRVFLFEDLILFSKTKKTDIGNDVYIYKQSFKVCTCPCSSKGCQNLNSQPFLNLKTQFTRNYCLNPPGWEISTSLSIFFFRQMTLGWLITLLWALCVLRSGSGGEKVRTPTLWEPQAWRWRNPGPQTWRGYSGIRLLIVEVVTTYCLYLAFDPVHGASQV